MIYDLYAELVLRKVCPTSGPFPAGLASGFVDECTVWSARDDRQRNNARKCYMKWMRAKTLGLPSELGLDPWPPALLHANWLALAVKFELLTPWYSKDDRLFHVLDNPVRKDRVFGVPFMSAASWKGLLRWACRMHARLRQHLEQGKRFEEWNDPNWILHLFGNEKGEDRKFRQGALVFYPTWFNKIGFEVINPHNRPRRAGTQPIYYEVVPGQRPNQKDGKQNRMGGSQSKAQVSNRRPGQEGGKGSLRLLYAPWPPMANQTNLSAWLPQLLQAIEDLLTRYGISAKRTVGWGTAKIERWCAWQKDREPIKETSRDEFERQLLGSSGGTA